MRSSTAAFVFAALVGMAAPSSAQFLPFSTGPLPIYGLRFSAALPVSSGVSYGAYGYSSGAYGVGDYGTFGYGVRPSHLRLRRALWIFQPQTTTRPTQQPNIPTTLPSTPEQSTYQVRNDRAVRDKIEAAITEARSWPPPRTPETPKAPASVSEITKAVAAEDPSGTKRTALRTAFQELSDNIKDKKFKVMGEATTGQHDVLLHGATALPKTCQEIENYLNATTFGTRKIPVFKAILSGAQLTDGARETFVKIYGEVIGALK
jgi:hypothetical protein